MDSVEGRVTAGVRHWGDAAGFVTEEIGQPVPPWPLGGMPGTGDICSTVGDLARFTAAVHSGSLIGPRSLAAMLTPHMPLAGQDTSDGSRARRRASSSSATTKRRTPRPCSGNLCLSSPGRQQAGRQGSLADAPVGAAVNLPCHRPLGFGYAVDEFRPLEDEPGPVVARVAVRQGS